MPSSGKGVAWRKKRSKRGVLYQRSRSCARILGQPFHRLDPVSEARPLPRSRPQTESREQQGVDHLLQVALGDGRVAVARENHFALLGDFQLGPARLGRASQDRPAHRPAATPDRAAAPVEEVSSTPASRRAPASASCAR